MSCLLSTDLRQKHNVRSMPIRKGDEVVIKRGQFHGNSGKVTTVYRRRWYINVEKITNVKRSGKDYPYIFLFLKVACHITSL
jgi:large subunit ribosomal protein L26e